MLSINVQTLKPGCGATFVSTALSEVLSLEQKVMLCPLCPDLSLMLSAFNLPIDKDYAKLDPEQAIRISDNLYVYPQGSELFKNVNKTAGQQRLEDLMDYIESLGFDILVFDCGCCDFRNSKAAFELCDLNLTLMQPNMACMLTASAHETADNEIVVFNQSLLSSELQADLILYASTYFSKDTLAPMAIPYDESVLKASIENTTVIETYDHCAAAKAVESLAMFCMLKLKTELAEEEDKE